MTRNQSKRQWRSLASDAVVGTSITLAFLSMGDVPAAQKKPANDRPVVVITSPAIDATYGVPLNLTIAATATDNNAIARVEFYLGKKLIGLDAISPYETTWRDVPAGNHSLMVRAIDTLGADTKVTIPFIALADPRASSGEWSPVMAWPDVGIHIHVLPNGRVLTWSDDDHPEYPNHRLPDSLKAFVVTDLETGAFVEIDNHYTNLFCSGHTFLPDGRLLVMGGHEIGGNGDGSVDANIFDYRLGAAGAWVKIADMASGRWYPTAITLANGEVLAVSGSGVGNPEIPEVWNPAGPPLTPEIGAWRRLTGAARPMPYYPFLHLTSTGRVFVSGPNTGYDPAGGNEIWNSSYLNTTGAGLWTPVAALQVPDRDYGGSIMYEPDKIVVIGGGDPATATTETIDLRSTTPTWTYSGSMAYPRRQHNSTLLPDGTVVVTGGTSGAGFNNADGAVLEAEVWRPSTGTWSTLAAMRVPRLYHSTAVLLPDGRILSAGGGRPLAENEAPPLDGSYGHENAEIFSPPYLFKGLRPEIASAPERVNYGQTFEVLTPDAARIAGVSWIRLSSASHSHNMGQRINKLKFKAGIDRLAVTAPGRALDAPPGHYMLFLLSANGVPSVAKIVQINAAGR